MTGQSSINGFAPYTTNSPRDSAMTPDVLEEKSGVTIQSLAAERARIFAQIAELESQLMTNSARQLQLPDTPGYKLFNTPEVLEAILFRLDIASLHITMSVNHMFRNIITGSPRLQQALFLRPDYAGHGKVLGYYHRFARLSPAYRLAVRDDSTPEKPLGIFEFYYDIFSEGLLFEDSSEEFCYDECDILEFDYSTRQKKRMRPPPTVMRMFISQPPVTNIKARVSCCRDRWDANGDEIIVNPDGLCVADLYRAGERIQRQHINCPKFSETRLRGYGRLDKKPHVDFECDSLPLKPNHPKVMRHFRVAAKKSAVMEKLAAEEVVWRPTWARYNTARLERPTYEWGQFVDDNPECVPLPAEEDWDFASLHERCAEAPDPWLDGGRVPLPHIPCKTEVTEGVEIGVTTEFRRLPHP